MYKVQSMDTVTVLFITIYYSLLILHTLLAYGKWNGRIIGRVSRIEEYKVS